MQRTKALVEILTILTWFKRLFMAGDLVYRIKHHKHPQIVQQWQICNLISTSTLTSPEIKTYVLLGISESHESRSDQKWLFAVSEINKMGIGFISTFLLKGRLSYLTILKRKNLSLPLKDETDQFVTCLVLPECLSVKIARSEEHTSELQSL